MGTAVSNGRAEISAEQLRNQGSAIDPGRIFVDYDEGRIFEPRDLTPRRIDEMLKRDGKARSIEQALTLPMRGAPWAIQPPAGDQGQTEFVREALTRPANAGGMSTPLELVIAQATGACLYRRSFFEKVLKVDPDSGRIVYDQVAFRPPATCRLKLQLPGGTFDGFSQYVGGEHPGADDEGRVWIKPQKAFVFVYGQHRRPIEGLSDLETVFTLWETKQKVLFLLATFLENLTMPKAIAKDGSDDENQIQALAKKVATLKGGGVVGIGQSQSVEAFETSNTAADVFLAALGYLDAQMTGSVLAGMLDLTGAAASGKGSFALSSSATDLFLQSRQAVLTELAAALTNWLVADLVRYNFGFRAPVPVFSFGPLVQQNVDQALELLQSLAATDKPPVPREFIDMLVEKIADFFGLDVTRVRKAIAAETSKAGDQTSQLVAGIQAATKIVQQQGLKPAPTPA